MYISSTDNSYYYQQSTAATSKPQKPSDAEFFSAVDSSGDDKVDQSELSTLMSNLEEETGHSVNVEEQFTEFDADGDGSYNSEELKSFLEANRPEQADMSELEGMSGMEGMKRAGGPPPPPPEGASTEEEDEESSYIEELLASLEESEESSANSYLTLFQSLQDELFSSSSDDDDDEDSSSVSDYLTNLNNSLTNNVDYTSLSIDA